MRRSPQPGLHDDDYDDDGDNNDDDVKFNAQVLVSATPLTSTKQATLGCVSVDRPPQPIS